MICPRCRATTAGNLSFCTNCGTALDSPASGQTEAAGPGIRALQAGRKGN
jgi:hypothetical protein